MTNRARITYLLKIKHRSNFFYGIQGDEECWKRSLLRQLADCWRMFDLSKRRTMCLLLLNPLKLITAWKQYIIIIYLTHCHVFNQFNWIFGYFSIIIPFSHYVNNPIRLNSFYWAYAHFFICFLSFFTHIYYNTFLSYFCQALFQNNSIFWIIFGFYKSLQT